MAHFCTTTTGTKTSTQIGHKTTGLVSHVNGYDLGCTARLTYNADYDRDEIAIIVTNGTNGQGSIDLGTFISNTDGNLVRID